MTLSALAELLDHAPVVGKFSLPADEWESFLAYLAPWQIVPATAEEPPSFWYRGVRVHQHAR